jgi:hypothetical protein
VSIKSVLWSLLKINSSLGILEDNVISVLILGMKKSLKEQIRCDISYLYQASFDYIKKVEQ